jgi:hypothetical protein
VRRHSYHLSLPRRACSLTRPNTNILYIFIYSLLLGYAVWCRRETETRIFGIMDLPLASSGEGSDGYNLYLCVHCVYIYTPILVICFERWVVFISTLYKKKN